MLYCERVGGTEGTLQEGTLTTDSCLVNEVGTHSFPETEKIGILEWLHRNCLQCRFLPLYFALHTPSIEPGRSDMNCI